MWEKQAGDVPGGQLHPWKEQRKRAQDMGEDASALLFVQLVLCVMIALIVFFAKMSQAPFFTDMRQQYQEMISYGVEFSSDNPMIRFATGGVDALRDQAQKVLDELQAYEPEALTGSGGFWPIKSREVPQGASMEPYVSPQELTLPVAGVFTSGFGFRENPVTGEDDFHAGIDLAAAEGTPVTVKMRAGWDGEHLTAVEVAKQCEANGAALITVHGRTREQMYIPPISPEVIRAVKQAVSVPVLGNGDITTAEDALAMIRETGCDGVMVGRGALGNPWLFEEIRAALLGQPAPKAPTLRQKMQTLRDQIYDMCERKGEWTAMAQARSQAIHYMRGLRGAAALRRACATLSQFEDVDRLIEAVYRAQD